MVASSNDYVCGATSILAVDLHKEGEMAGQNAEILGRSLNVFFRRFAAELRALQDEEEAARTDAVMWC